jgi:hypothetical protein
VLQLLDESIDAHASLYEGDAGRALDKVAPYLVKLSPDSGLVDRLVHEGWGRAWGIWLTSSAMPKLVRRALRRLLMVQAEGRRERMYFRFYDPRVLVRFLPLATVRQKSELLSDITSICYEDGAAQPCVLGGQQDAVDGERV